MPKNLNVRFEDDDLHQRVTDAAGDDRRSVNSEVLQLIDWGLEIRDLRARLAKDQAILLERKVKAYEARDTYREAHLDGQIAGIQVALAYLWTPPVFARTARPTAIHHINGDSRDNRPENLAIVDLEAHARTATPTDTEETP